MILYQQELGNGDVAGRSIITFLDGRPPVYPPGPTSGRTLYYFGSMAGNPIAAPVDIHDLTGITAPALGVDGGVNGRCGAQATGGAAAFALAPRALSSSPYIHGVTCFYNWVTPSKPFTIDPTLRIETKILHLYSYVKPIPGSPGTMEWEGNTTFYSTLALYDTTTRNSLWWVTRIYQHRVASEPYESSEWPTWSANEVFYIDPSNNFALVDSILQPSSSRIVPTDGSSYFYTGGPRPAWVYYGYDITADNFSRTIAALNTWLAGKKTYSTNPADYALTEWNLDMECWAIYVPPNEPSDPRIAVSCWDTRVMTVAAGANPTLITVLPDWIPSLQIGAK